MPDLAARPLRVAVVGAGPAGCYATEALLASGVDVSVDVLERLPSPHGLVRYGVAPDHWTVKSKSVAFDRILGDERVRLRGNVALGRDLSHEDLRHHYDAVLYAVGAAADRRLGIPGEDLAGSLSATDLVGWYNGHPDRADLDPPLDARRVVVVGMGNVALDVTRMLLTDPERLARTDMADHAVSALRQARVQEVHVLGRRGPSQAGFTPKELREVAELPGVQVVVDPTDLLQDRPGPPGTDLAARRRARNVELFAEYARARRRRLPTVGRRVRRVHVRFCVSPVEVVGDVAGAGPAGAGRTVQVPAVAAVRLERNRLVESDGRVRAQGTGEVDRLDCQLLLRSVGYRGTPLPGVPFDDERGVVPSVGGRVTTVDGVEIPGEYVSGWMRRGPSGVIGTNKVDAAEVVSRLLADAPSLPGAASPDPRAVDSLLRFRGVQWVDYRQWRLIAAAERRLGSRRHRAAAKFPTVQAALDHLAQAS